MPKQDGILPIKGSVDNITFYKSGDGFMARKKTGIEKGRMANDPAFQRTRENGAEFGRAGRAVKLVRSSVRGLLQNVADRRSVARMVREMMKVIQADSTNARGLRNVIDGEAELLTGFEFNENGKLGATLFAPFTGVINRVTGELSVSFASFIPSQMVLPPPAATHFKITSAGAEVDFENGRWVSQANSTAELPLNSQPTAMIDLVNVVTPNSVHPLFVMAGIQFLQEVNGTFYPLKSGAFNALAIVKVSGH